jgi:hypothetical protein
MPRQNRREFFLAPGLDTLVGSHNHHSFFRRRGTGDHEIGRSLYFHDAQAAALASLTGSRVLYFSIPMKNGGNRGVAFGGYFLAPLRHEA